MAALKFKNGAAAADSLYERRTASSLSPQEYVSEETILISGSQTAGASPTGVVGQAFGHDHDNGRMAGGPPALPWR